MMEFLEGIKDTISEYRWQRLLAQIAAESSREWRPIVRFAWPSEEHVDHARSFAVPKYYRVHRHPDPFRGDWERYGLPRGWTHAGVDPEHLISIYGDGARYGFVTEFEPRRTDCWCGDFGVERSEFRCAHQLPRVAEFATQVAIVRHYLRRYGSLALHEFFHEVPVSHKSHPPAARRVYRYFADNLQTTELFPKEIDSFVRLGGQAISSVTSFQPQPDLERETIDPESHYDQSPQPMVGGHPVEVFFAYLLLGTPTFDALERWVKLCDTTGFRSALDQIKCSSVFETTQQDCAHKSWFETLDNYMAALDLHARRLRGIHCDAPDRFERGMALAAVEVLSSSDRLNPRRTNPDFLSDLKWRVDDFATDGRIPSSHMPRHRWN